MLGERPKASGFAAIDDIAKFPLTSENGRKEYGRFLAAALPRAIALSTDAKFWAWKSDVFDAMAQAASGLRSGVASIM